MSWCLWLLQKASNKPYGSSCFPSYLVQCLNSQLPLQWPPKAPCKASRAELTRIRHTAWPPLFAVVLLSRSSPPTTWRCSVTRTPPPGSSRVAKQTSPKLPRPNGLELEAGFSGNSYVGFVSWLFVGLGREVTHALCARQRTTRQHPQWSLRRGGKSNKDGDNMWMRIPRAKKLASWHIRRCVATCGYNFLRALESTVATGTSLRYPADEIFINTTCHPPVWLHTSLNLTFGRSTQEIPAPKLTLRKCKPDRWLKENR